MIYRRCGGEVWGALIKSHRADKITDFILKKFEYAVVRRYLPLARRTIKYRNSWGASQVPTTTRTSDFRRVLLVRSFVRDSSIFENYLDLSPGGKDLTFAVSSDVRGVANIIKVLSVLMKKSYLRSGAIYRLQQAGRMPKFRKSFSPARIETLKWFENDPTILKLVRKRHRFPRVSD